MNGYVILETGMWGAAIVFTVAAYLGWDGEPPPVHDEPYPLAALPAVPQKLSASQILTAANVAIEKNPFRFERRPAVVRFGGQATTNGPAHPEADAPAEPPRLVLRGILGGPPWEALLEGIPGIEGSLLVKAGDRFGDLRVRSIDAENVVVQSADASWRLTLDTAWQ